VRSEEPFLKWRDDLARLLSSLPCERRKAALAIVKRASSLCDASEALP
jgi:hypothetical protein